MRVVLDTNVFVSGIFFTGPPSEILRAWSRGRLTLAISPAILDEYRRVAAELSRQYRGVDLEHFLRLLDQHADVVRAPDLPESVCTDPDDDKFLACAIAGRSRTIISGDRALLKTSGFRGIRVLRPREFVEEHLAPDEEGGGGRTTR